MSDLPNSAIEIAQPDNTSQWLKNLDIDFVANKERSTPPSIRTDPGSTPALPEGIAESKGTATPQQFAPEEDDNGSQTVSNVTYNKICESNHFIFFPFFSPRRFNIHQLR